MKVNIEKLDHFGRGITYINDKICFVENALPGEVVKVKVSKETKKYTLAKVVDFYKLSDDRVEVKCPYADVCGGCNTSHLSLEKENEFKCDKVKEILKKFANIDSKVISDIVCDDELNYRNKVTLHGLNNCLGFYKKGTNLVVRVEKCLLADKKINQVISLLNEIAYEENIDEALIRVSNDSDEVMVSLKGSVHNYDILRNRVDVLEINGEVIFGDGLIISPIGKKKYYVSSKSFFQVNKSLTEKLYNEVLKVVEDVKPKNLLDLYCGTGTIGIYVSDHVDKIIGVDYSSSGIEDAKKNAELNKVRNAEFICDKVENVIEKFDNIDMVVVDPPRAGLDSKTIENIKRIKASDVVYISCDPVTLARDLRELSDVYDIVEIKPYNMFPRTYHVENVVCLRIKEFK